LTSDSKVLRRPSRLAAGGITPDGRSIIVSCRADQLMVLAIHLFYSA